MTRKECYAILELAEGSDLAAVKRAYRRLAFALHPDLNPDVPDAARRFQQLNEAYVLLSQGGPAAKAAKAAKESAGKAAAGAEASAKAREDAQKAYAKAKAAQKDAPAGDAQKAQDGKGKEDILRDILNDPFARRVFEDIYSHMRYESQPRSSASRDTETRSPDGQQRKKTAGTPRSQPQSARKRPPAYEKASVETDGMMGKLKGWLRKQIDDVQVLRLPGESLVPGARVRLQIRHGLSDEPQIVELTLPPEFVPGKAMRLKGMGKRVGNWRGDLYVRIEPA